MLDLAEAKRDLYRHNAHPFQRPANDARTLQRPFFEGLLGRRDDFIVLVHEDASTHVDGFLIGRIGPTPPPIGAAGDPFHVDDFAVDRPDLWPSTGDAVLREAARLAHAAGARKAVIVAGSQEIDPLKRAFLHRLGLTVAAEWWVRPLDAAPGDVPDQDGFEAIVGPAPPVYDPGVRSASQPAWTGRMRFPTWNGTEQRHGPCSRSCRLRPGAKTYGPCS